MNNIAHKYVIKRQHPHRRAHNFKHDLVANNVCVKTTKSDKNYLIVIHC